MPPKYSSADNRSQTAIKPVAVHPTRKADDQTVKLRAVTAEPQNGRMEYEAVFKPLRPTNHWYLRVEDASGVWRVETNG